MEPIINELSNTLDTQKKSVNGIYLISLVSGDSRDRIHNFNEVWSDLPEDIHEVCQKMLEIQMKNNFVLV